MPMTKNVSKNRMDFLACEQSISSSKAEAITEGMIQDKKQRDTLLSRPHL